MTLPGASSTRAFTPGNRLARFIPPVFDERHRPAEQFRQPCGDLVQRAFGLAADVTKDDLFPTLLASIFQRIDHRPEPDISLANLFSRLGVHVASHQHWRAARYIRQRIQARNGRQVIFQSDGPRFGLAFQ